MFKEITISANMTEQDIHDAEQIWHHNDDVIICAQSNLLPYEISFLFWKWSVHVDCSSLARAVLSKLVEHDSFPQELLVEAFSIGDTGTKVAVCLKDYLSSEVKSLCSNSSDEEVIAHYVFNSSVSINECNEILKRSRLPGSAKEAIKRAILYKQQLG